MWGGGRVREEECSALYLGPCTEFVRVCELERFVWKLKDQ